MEKKITQVFILGAGLGTRLRPLTDTIPKVMLPIAPGKPLLEYQIEWLRSQGIKKFIINVHYLPEVITSYFGDGRRWGVTIIYSDEVAKLMETAGALKKAKSLLDDNFLFLYGDELSFLDVGPLIDLHLKKNALATITLKPWHLPQDGEVAEFDLRTNRITKWYARPHHVAEPQLTPNVNAGIYCLSKRLLNYIPGNTPIKLDGAVIPRAFTAGEPLYAFPTYEAIMDIGKPDQYEAAKSYYAEKMNL